jgi:intraflagellar transport protein 81
MEDKLTLFRQQAAIIARKKDSTAEKLNDVRVEFAAIEDEIKDKKSGKQYGYFSKTLECILANISL